MNDSELETSEPLPRLDPLPSGNDPAALDIARREGWNWGGFLVPYLWLIGHGQVSWGMVLLVSSLVPFLSFLHLFAYPLIALTLGFRGYEMAWRHQPYHSLDQMRESERTWGVWGLLSVVAFVAVMVLSFFYLRVMMGDAMKLLEDAGI